LNHNPVGDEPHLFELVFLQLLGADYLAMKSTNVKDLNFIKNIGDTNFSLV
jgi:hypothetical protein